MRADLPLPDSAWSLAPEALAVVEAEVRERRPEHVVELGCGISTLAIGRVLAETGGHLASLEHDADWAQSITALVEQDGSAKRVGIEVAPLEPHRCSLDGARWYAAEAIGRLPQQIGLLLVDGPPGNEPGIELSRYPALPALARRLAPGAAIVLDDASRPGEREILRRWQDQHPIEFELAAGGRIAIGSYSSSSYSSHFSPTAPVRL